MFVCYLWGLREWRAACGGVRGALGQICSERSSDPQSHDDRVELRGYRYIYFLRLQLFNKLV